jgi:hypothetical protein
MITRKKKSDTIKNVIKMSVIIKGFTVYAYQLQWMSKQKKDMCYFEDLYTNYNIV